MATTSFEDDVTRAFRRLVQSGATMESRLTGPYFDDASIVLSTAAFRLRATRDRGLVAIELAGRDRPEEWYPLEWVIAAVMKMAPASPGSVGLEEGASLVQVHSQAISERMTGSQAGETVELFNQFAEERLDALERGEWPRPRG